MALPPVIDARTRALRPEPSVPSTGSPDPAKK